MCHGGYIGSFWEWIEYFLVVFIFSYLFLQEGFFSISLLSDATLPRKNDEGFVIFIYFFFWTDDVLLPETDYGDDVTILGKGKEKRKGNGQFLFYFTLFQNHWDSLETIESNNPPNRIILLLATWSMGHWALGFGTLAMVQKSYYLRK